MNNEDKVIKNLKQCPRFDWCSVNICPLDLEVNLRTKIQTEKNCPFTIKKRRKDQKGIKLLLSNNLLKFVPKSNSKMLNKGNLKRWNYLYKKNEKRISK